MSHVPRMRHRSKVQVEFFAMTKLNRACPASVSVDRRNCHEFGSVERFFNFLIPINLIHIFMITDELHSVPTNIARRAPREQRRYCMSAFGRGRWNLGPTPLSALGQKQTCAVLSPCPLYPQKRTCAVQLVVSLWAKSGHRTIYVRSGSNAATRGKVTLISVNSPGCVSISIEPPCFLTMIS